MPRKKSKKNPSVSPVLVIGLILFAIVAGAYVMKDQFMRTKEAMMEATGQSTTGSTALIYSDIADLYNGDIPLDVVSQKKGYEMFPFQLKDLTLTLNQVSEGKTSNFEPLVVMYFGDATLPLSEAYTAYYQIPDSEYPAYGLEGDDLRSLYAPVRINQYTINREITKEDLAEVRKPASINCVDDEARSAEHELYEASDLLLVKCSLGYSEEQKLELVDLGYGDTYYMIVFKDHMKVVEINIGTAYVSDPDSFVKTYIATLVADKPTAFAGESNINTIEDSREFEEFRKGLFDK